MDLLSKMIVFATFKHSGQVCKGGQPYILHPLAVMGKVQSIDAKVVAVGHDLLEDTETTVEELRAQGCGEQHIQAIIALTKLKGETRLIAAQRTLNDRLACEVKLADIEHNMDSSRLPQITEKDLKRLAEYQEVKKVLEDAKIKLWNNFS